MLIEYQRLQVVQQPRRARMCGFGDKVHMAVSNCTHILLKEIRKRVVSRSSANLLPHTQSFLLCHPASTVADRI
jgi:hypothetical protein